MESGTIVAILGVLATVTFGALSIYLFVKRRYPGQITFVVEDCLGLFESVVKHFQELAISYKNSPVGEGIVLLKGALVNTGSKDITKEMVEGRLRLALPDEFKWLQAKVVSSSPSVQAQIEQEPQTLSFDTGLFRCREFVRFECLAEVPMPDDGTESTGMRLLKKLDVTHRIADTQYVNPMHLPPEYAGGLSKRRLILWVGIMILGVGMGAVFFVKGVPARLHYHIANDSGERIEVTARPQDNGDILIRGVKQKSFKKQLPASDFFLTPDLEPNVLPNRVAKFVVAAIAALYVLVPFVMCWLMFREQRKARQIRSLLGLVDQDDDSKKEDPTRESRTTSG